MYYQPWGHIIELHDFRLGYFCALELQRGNTQIICGSIVFVKLSYRDIPYAALILKDLVTWHLDT